jgi:hypothetical protein
MYWFNHEVPPQSWATRVQSPLGKMRDDFDQFLFRDSVVERLAQVKRKLLATVQSYQS